jgi:hypothetical protein
MKGDGKGKLYARKRFGIHGQEFLGEDIKRRPARQNDVLSGRWKLSADQLFLFENGNRTTRFPIHDTLRDWPQSLGDLKIGSVCNRNIPTPLNNNALVCIHRNIKLLKVLHQHLIN